jgi:hypothetical protein
MKVYLSHNKTANNIIIGFAVESKYIRLVINPLEPDKFYRSDVLMHNGSRLQKCLKSFKIEERDGDLIGTTFTRL